MNEKGVKGGRGGESFTSEWSYCVVYKYEWVNINKQNHNFYNDKIKVRHITKAMQEFEI